MFHSLIPGRYLDSDNPYIVKGNLFGDGKGPIWRSNSGCTGQEDTIEECAGLPWGDNTCSHDEDVGIICRSPGLECYTCDGVINPMTCNETERCGNGGICEQTVYTTNGKRRHSMTCRSQLTCNAMKSSPVTVGRRSKHERQTASNFRFDCCSTPLCNRNLFDLEPSSQGASSTSCMDDSGVDCQALDHATNVCKNKGAAETLCPKHCGLCS
ncbi:Soluble scavenger receptor cysteine-rich domain-containing protein SSC5D [Mizuhopecten yessoensis]|uniref:Soluble scavenger receptor cysteine-rich domain-containing protein SSC5D n=1 Tax=Mizuhopecten yessoensis TaxID=6573 RepID=A0A210QVD9_MIZYE|nr:Soluble scavenger receptor cysteine-rich domain-containing protein SSC5D [Mizuhopecten yessoensis]